MEPVYEYKGYQYLPWDDYEDDNVKRFHDVKTPTGETIHLDMSPYARPTEETFKKWVDLGCPKTELMQPNYSPEDIEEMWRKNAKRFINEKDSQND